MAKSELSSEVLDGSCSSTASPQPASSPARHSSAAPQGASAYGCDSDGIFAFLSDHDVGQKADLVQRLQRWAARAAHRCSRCTKSAFCPTSWSLKKAKMPSLSQP